MINFQSAADDSEAKSNELTRAVDELHKLLKEAGEGKIKSMMRWFCLGVKSSIFENMNAKMVAYFPLLSQNSLGTLLML